MSGGPHKVLGAKKADEDNDFDWGVTTSNDKKASGGYAAFGAAKSSKIKKIEDEDDDIGGLLDHLEVEKGLKKKEELEKERVRQEEEKKTPRGLVQKGKSFAVGTHETEFDDIEDNQSMRSGGVRSQGKSLRER